MSIYEKGSPVLGINFAWIAKIPRPVLGAALIILALIAGYLFFNAYPYALTKGISFAFDKNPVTANEQVLLSVVITNTTGEIANDVKVYVSAVDQRSFSVDKPQQTIEVLDRSRKLTYLINPVGAVKPGEYEFKVSAIINEKRFEETAVLTVAEK